MRKPPVQVAYVEAACSDDVGHSGEGLVIVGEWFGEPFACCDAISQIVKLEIIPSGRPGFAQQYLCPWPSWPSASGMSGLRLLRLISGHGITICHPDNPSRRTVRASMIANRTVPCSWYS